MAAIGRTDLTGPSYAHNQHRVQHQDEIESAIVAWTSRHTIDEVESVMRQAGVPVGRVNTVADVVENEQTKARGAIREVEVLPKGRGHSQGWTVKMQGTFPVLNGVDSQPRWAGPELGQHTEEVLVNDLGLSPEEIARLREGALVA